MGSVSVTTARVLPETPFTTLEAYTASGGGEGLRAARAVEPEVVIAELEASGLRGRGGAGFPTGTKWRTIASYASTLLNTSVVVNAAEGEPGTYKDRSILLANPYGVLEGALIAARAMGARQITVATKARFTDVIARLHAAIAEMERAQWNDEISIEVLEGPGEYLYGEETALLEVVDGRPPLPRLAPPWRRGVVEVVRTDADAVSESGLSADVDLATSAPDNVVPPVLVNNVETLANVPNIVAKGASWFRELGTQASPGTIVCTVTGEVQVAGVVEVPMGTTVRDLIDGAGGGHREGREITGVLMGVSSAFLPADELDVPITYEAMRERGSGLGSASFIVVDDSTHPVSLAAGVSRFLAVESCGQCTPCKWDGLEISSRLQHFVSGEAIAAELETIRKRLNTIDYGARCSLAGQHQTVVGSILDRFPVAFRSRLGPGQEPLEPFVVAEMIGISEDRAELDDTFTSKQPDWTYDAVDSGQPPAARLGDHRMPES
jgi:NADH:ubiquinone oxidoreductase subunit F (NADH-binding)